MRGHHGYLDLGKSPSLYGPRRGSIDTRPGHRRFSTPIAKRPIAGIQPEVRGEAFERSAT